MPQAARGLDTIICLVLMGRKRAQQLSPDPPRVVRRKNCKKGPMLEVR